MARIGNRASALERLERFLEELDEYGARRPPAVALFAEDYAALGPADVRRLAARGIRVVPGPSVREYESDHVLAQVLAAAPPAAAPVPRPRDPDGSRVYRVGTFAHENGVVTAYVRDYSPSWSGCIEYEIRAKSAAEAKRIAAARRREEESKA